MGVDYSTTLGWGLALEEMPSVISTDPYIDEYDVQEWLVENDYELIKYECCGNWMSGEYIHLFYLDGTRQRLDPMYDEGVRSFDSPEITPEAGIEFKRLCEQLNVPWPESLAWKLIFNVS